MNENIKYGKAVREAIKRGVDALANAVKVTLGPKGRNVIIDRPGRPVVTKDGVSVARAVNVSDPFEQLGVRLVREAASKTADEAGDGTTTATVLAQAIYSGGLKQIEDLGADPLFLKNELDVTAAKVVEILRRASTPVKDVEQLTRVATISANGDEQIGRFVAQAVSKVGKDGAVTVVKSPTALTTLDMGDGLKVDGGLSSHYFVTNPEKNETVLDEPYVLIYKDPILNFKPLMGLMQQVIDSQKSLLIIAEQVEGEALTNIIYNKLNQKIRIAVAKAPAYGELREAVMKDIAVAVGTTVGTKDLMPLDKVTLAQLGRAGRASITPTSLTIVEGKGTKATIDSHVEFLKSARAEAQGLERTHLNDRISRLTGGIALLRVGAESEVELKEKMDRVEDAVGATMAALSEGVVRGGGLAMVMAANELLAQHTSAVPDVLLEALFAPAAQIEENAGGNFQVSDDVVDPTKVTVRALLNAVSVAGTMLTTEVIVGQPEVKE